MSQGARLRILVFSDWFLPGFRAGGPIRSLANLVSQFDAEFWLVTRITDHHSDIPYDGIPEGEWVPFNPRTRVLYLRESALTLKRVDRLLHEFPWDVIYLNSLFSPRFTLIPLWAWRREKAQRMVLAPRGMLKGGALSQKSAKKKWFVRLSRWYGLFEGVIWHATNPEEMREIRSHYGESAEVRLAPNLPDRNWVNSAHPAKIPGELRLVCIARISPEKGILEALRMLAAAGLGRGLTVTFYGVRQNAEYFAQCRALAESIPGADISFPGEIAPTEVPGVLSRYHFLYLATRGENFGHAIAESLLHSTPVIISDRTPWRDIHGRGAGWDLPLSPDHFVPVLRKCWEMGQQDYESLCSRAGAWGKEIAADKEGLEDYRRLFS